MRPRQNRDQTQRQWPPRLLFSERRQGPCNHHRFSAAPPRISVCSTIHTAEILGIRLLILAVRFSWPPGSSVTPARRFKPASRDNLSGHYRSALFVSGVGFQLMIVTCCQTQMGQPCSTVGPSFFNPPPSLEVLMSPAILYPPAFRGHKRSE